MHISKKSYIFARFFVQGMRIVRNILLGVLGTVLGIVVLLSVIVVCVVCIPSARQAVLDKGIEIAREKTGMEIELGRLYLSPFHHSPMVLYRAYKGQEELPLQVEVDSLFVGKDGDTLICVQTLRLKAKARLNIDSILATPIEVEQLYLEGAAFHSDSMIAAVGVDAVVGLLDVTSPEIVIAEGKYPLYGLRLHDADVGIDLRETPPDTTVQDTTPLLLAFEVPDGELRNIHFQLQPIGLDINTGYIGTDATIDVGSNLYDARRIEIGRLAFGIGSVRIPADTIYGGARVDLSRNLITSRGLHVRSDEMGARADLSTTEMNLATMRVEAQGDAEYKGSKASLRATYDIDDEIYDAAVHIDRVNLSAFMHDKTPIVLAGDIEASGRGINPKRAMQSRVKVRLNKARYGQWNLSRSSITASTDSVTDLAVRVPGVNVDFSTPMPLFTFIDKIQPLVTTVSDSALLHGLTSLEDLTVLDTIRHDIPAMRAAIDLRHGSPIQAIIDSTGLDIDDVSLELISDSAHTDLAVAISLPDINHPEDSTAMRLPASKAAMRVSMTEGRTDASLSADTRLTDGAMSVYGLCADAAFRMALVREGTALNGEGRLTIDSLSYRNMDLGSRAIDLQISPSDEYEHALRADVRSEDIPLDIVDGFVSLPEELALRGAVRVSAAVDGLPKKTDISAQVLPLGVRAEYTPYEVAISLGETPIVMEHNRIDLNGLPVYGVDSTFIALNGGLDLDSMQMDITISADSFAPVKLAKTGPFPVYGELATDIQGTVTGPLDSIVADVAVSILPTTDITYPIDKKNLAQVRPHGTVTARYGTADGSLELGGRVNVDDGFIRYSPKAYPIMPFHVDSGSHVSFHGPIGKTKLNVSASQKVKADVESNGEDTRRVDFRTGVRVNGEVDSIGIKSIGFFLEAPEDEAITRELASVDEGTREGLAATLLATGMYVGESNVAAQREGYALSSIINSRINAAMANSKVGKFMEVDFSSAQTTRATGKTNDMNIAISKSFFKDKLRVTIGSTITDNPDVNKTQGLFSSLTADYKLTKDGNVLLRVFSQRDYNNILEGELNKSGIGVRATKDWKKMSPDSIMRTYNLTADVDVAYRSNNSIGPDVTLKSSIKNLIGNGETFTLKGNGAYYWALRNRHPGDPKKTDTYKLGVNASLIFPYLHWVGDNNPSGDTRYMLGYQYENIAGGYGVHKMSGSFTYFIHSTPYITHAFTPFSLSVVRMKAESEELLNKAADYPQLIKILAGDEFIPSIGYNFIYNDYHSKRAVNTMLDLGVKESGNLINALYCAFGYKWSDLEKPLGKITFNQFVKLSVEMHNKFNFTEQVSLATRVYAGANIPLGNSMFAPLSEAFYAGGPNSLRATSPYTYGPGNFYSAKYNQNFFHSGDMRLEANVELRFPIVWKLYGAAFVDAGNVWNWYSTVDLLKAGELEDYIERLEIPSNLYDGVYNNPEFARQIALGTGAGLRLDLEGLVVRLDIGVAIHAPYQTYKYDKEWKVDYSRPINTYFNIPSALDAIRVNFGIGYPF